MIATWDSVAMIVLLTAKMKFTKVGTFLFQASDTLSRKNIIQISSHSRAMFIALL